MTVWAGIFAWSGGRFMEIPIQDGSETVGQLSVREEGLYRVFRARCAKRDGVQRLWLCGGGAVIRPLTNAIGEMLDMVNTIIRYSMEIFAKSDETHLQDVVELEEKIDLEERKLQENHVRRLAAGECTPEAGMIFSDIVSGLERVADHATNIAFAIKEEEDNLLAAKQGATPIAGS